MRTADQKARRSGRVAALAACALTLAGCALTLAGCGILARHAASAHDPAGQPDPAGTAGQVIPAGSSSHVIEVGGVRRTFIVYRPASLPAAAPLVVMLHGGYGSAQQAQ